jgi:hypothetical protein
MYTFTDLQTVLHRIPPGFPFHPFAGKTYNGTASAPVTVVKLSDGSIEIIGHPSTKNYPLYMATDAIAGLSPAALDLSEVADYI